MPILYGLEYLAFTTLGFLIGKFFFEKTYLESYTLFRESVDRASEQIIDGVCKSTFFSSPNISFNRQQDLQRLKEELQSNLEKAILRKINYENFIKETE